MKLTDKSRWLIALIVFVVVEVSIAVFINLNTIYNFGKTNAKVEASSKENIERLDENNAKLDEINTNLGNKIDSSSEKTIAAINNSSTAIVDAIRSTLGSTNKKIDSTSESSDYLVQNTSGNSIFAVVESDNQEVYLNLAGAIQETGLVPNSEVLCPIVLITLNDRLCQEDLARLLSLSEVPIVKESFVTYNRNSAEYSLIWNILVPSVVPSNLKGSPLTISYVTTN